jgi:hypothetical protein
MYNIASKKVTRLTTDSMRTLTVSDDGRIGLHSNSDEYEQQRMWGDVGNDIYLVDVATGSKKLLRKKITGSATLSPEGKYITMFDNNYWYVYNIATGATVNLNDKAKNVHFEQETASTPDEPGPWGIAGWTRNDRSMLVYDQFDLWEMDPTGVRAPINVTDSVGTKNRIQLRILNLTPRENAWYGDTESLMFTAFNENTKASGWYRDKLGTTAAPERIIMSDMRYGALTKARDAEIYMTTKATFVQPPNIYVGPTITAMNTKLSDVNAFQKEYNWGTAELVKWTSTDGVPLSGILYKPENFDPTKKYPMVAYFYEDLSDGLHSYIAPNGRNTINPTHYVSNGYLVFEPDIHYVIGHPGRSAMNSIVPGVQMLLNRGYVDPKGLGLQGQSWGGYQTLYMITQSKMFSAAMAGAPVTNMFSAYGGIRWGSGIARSVQYENGQSRIGQSIWEAPMLYWENSPQFHLQYVETPLFIMHNDMDDAVPWYQGIELFVGMKRLGKEAYMITYNQDVHNPSSRANQKDMAMRMQQFFDAKLKGAPAPDWMVKGIPQKDKGRDQLAKPDTQIQQQGGRRGGPPGR